MVGHVEGAEADIRVGEHMLCGLVEMEFLETARLGLLVDPVSSAQDAEDTAEKPD